MGKGCGSSRWYLREVKGGSGGGGGEEELGSYSTISVEEETGSWCLNPRARRRKGSGVCCSEFCVVWVSSRGAGGGGSCAKENPGGGLTLIFAFAGCCEVDEVSDAYQIGNSLGDGGLERGGG